MLPTMLFHTIPIPNVYRMGYVISPLAMPLNAKRRKKLREAQEEISPYASRNFFLRFPC